MIADSQIGLYGKLPAYGDFLTRNLTADFIQPWDEWLQYYISASREQIGENWLDIYLTSPIWRFVISTGVIDQYNWAGLIMPSVDRVGRYFPVSIVKPFPEHLSPVQFLFSEQAWYEQVESLVLMALDESLDVDELIASADEIPLNLPSSYQATGHLGEMGGFVIGMAAADDQNLSGSLPYLLNASLSTGLASFSLWQTSGSELIAPSLFCCQGLPSVGSVASMIDGQWQARNWKIPYNLNS